VTDEQFKILFKRIEAAYNQEYTALQFEEWLDSFGKEDLGIADRAFRLMKDDFGYPPVVATFRSYIQRIKEQDEAQAKSAAKVKQRERRHEPRGNGGSHSRFAQYMLERKEQFKGWLKGTMEVDEYKRLKAKFEKEHPNWKPKKSRSAKSKGMTKIGVSLGDAMGNLE